MQLRILRSITAAQSAFITGKSTQEIFSLLLTDLLDLTGSEYGFIGEVLYEDGKPYLKTFGLTDISWNSETKAFYDKYADTGMEFRNLKTLFGAALVSGEPVIANDPLHDARSGGLPKGHPGLKAFLGLPIKFGNVMVGMAGLANRADGYDMQNVADLEPLMSIIGQLIDARRARIEAETHLNLLREMESHLTRQNELQQMVSQLATMLLSRRYDRLPEVFQTVLQLSGRTLKADRACIIARSFENEAIRLQYHWESPGKSLPHPFWTAEATPWLIKELAGQPVVSVIEVEALPEEAARDVLFFKQLECRSFLAYPFLENEELLGFLIFTTADKNKSWHSAEVQPIRLLAEMLTATFIRAFSEQALSESEDRLNRSQRFANIGIWDWHIDTGELHWSDLIGPLFGYKPGEVQTSYENFLAAVHPDDRQLVINAVQAAVEEKAPYDIEHRVLWPDGTIRWLSEKGDVMRDPSGKAVRMLGAVQDITQKKMEQQALQASEKRFRELLAKVPFAMAVLNRIGDVLFLNDQFRSSLGYTDAQLRHISDWWPLAYPDTTYRREVMEHWNALASIALKTGGNIPAYEYTIVRGDGRTGVFEVAGLFIDDNLMVTFIDVTEKKRAETEVKEHQWKLSALFRLSPVGIALNRLSDGKYLEVNSAFARMLGYSEEEVEALTYWQLTPEDYRQQEDQQIESLHTRGFYGPYEKEYIHREGYRIPVLLNGVRFSDSSGEQLIWSVVQDISDWKKIERMKSEFVSTVSHELRTPLTSIIGSLSLLQAGVLGEINKDQSEIVGIAHKNGQRLTNLINDLLDMEKIASGEMQFDFKSYNLKSILDSALEANRHLIVEKQMQIVSQIPTESLYVYVDSMRLHQVFTNLLSNAVKFSPSGSKVTIIAEKLSDTIKISIADEGRGIPERFHERIFQKFSQADASDSKAHGGTGLGLAISRELVEKMHGEIGFVSQEGKGSTFYVIFPTANRDGDG